MEERDVADALLVTEVFTPQGNWSSYPPHRHDEDDFPRMTYLEETYYHRLNPPPASACSGSSPRTARSTRRWRSPTTTWCWCPKGHHPCARALRLRPVLPQRHGRPAAASGASRTTPTSTGSPSATADGDLVAQRTHSATLRTQSARPRSIVDNGCHPARAHSPPRAAIRARKPAKGSPASRQPTTSATLTLRPSATDRTAASASASATRPSRPTARAAPRRAGRRRRPRSRRHRRRCSGS